MGKRLRDIGDARLLLEEGVAEAPPSGDKRRAVVLGVLAITALLAAATFAFLHIREQPATAPQPVRFDIASQGANEPTPLSVSPDGRYIVFVEPGPSGAVIRLRAMDSLQIQMVSGSEGAVGALGWSPDSRFILFVAGDKLKKAAVSGGTAETLADAGKYTRQVVWSRDGNIYLQTAYGIARMPEAGGPATILVPSGSRVLKIHLLPDGKHFLFSAGDSSVPGTTLGIYGGTFSDLPSLASTWRNLQPLVTTDVEWFTFTPAGDGQTGYLLFMREGALLAQLLDTSKLQLIGAPTTVEQNVSAFSASHDVLAYRTGAIRADNQLRWFNRQGQHVGTLGEPGPVGDVTIGRDGKTVIIDRVDSATNHVWVGDTARGAFNRLVPGDVSETGGTAAPDGTVVLTMAHPGEAGELYAVHLNSSTPQALQRSRFINHPNDVSPDGRYLIYDVHGDQRQDLYVLDLQSPGSPPVPFLATAADETGAQFSPDGKWVAYRSDETGRPEVFVRAFLPGQDPAAGGRNWLISTAGGGGPRWSRDGRELYYISRDGKLMATPVKTGAHFEPGVPVPLFDFHGAGFWAYDVAPDGRFLINTPLSTTGTAAPITVVLNWLVTLNK